ncbi:MAG: tripartite tricarboxylate transporter substrate-binding protein [Pseudomonadota bacterium]
MRRRSFLGGAAVSLAAPAVLAQSWPARPIRVVVPLPPGSAADAVPRAIALRLQAALGVPCVIENKPGAAGAIGADTVAKAPPDGYTLLSHTSAIVIQPHLRPAPYDVLRDFAPIAQTIAGSYVLVAQPSFPANNLREFIATVRRAPGRYSYGSYGSGSGPHLAMELLKRDAGLFILHVPFRGAAPALQELLAGRLDMAFDTTFAAVPHIRAGRLKAIALGGPRAVDALPGVGTVAQLYPGFDTDGWQGFFAPAGMPGDIVRTLADGIAKALRDPELAATITDLGFRPVGNTPEQFAAVVRADHDKWGRVVRERRIRAD